MACDVEKARLDGRERGIDFLQRHLTGEDCFPETVKSADGLQRTGKRGELANAYRSGPKRLSSQHCPSNHDAGSMVRTVCDPSPPLSEPPVEPLIEANSMGETPFSSRLSRARNSGLHHTFSSTSLSFVYSRFLMDTIITRLGKEIEYVDQGQQCPLLGVGKSHE